MECVNIIQSDQNVLLQMENPLLPMTIKVNVVYAKCTKLEIMIWGGEMSPNSNQDFRVPLLGVGDFNVVADSSEKIRG